MNTSTISAILQNLQAGGSHDGERDDLTFSEKIVNLLLFFVILVASIIFIIQLAITFKNHSRKNYTKVHYSIILLIFWAAIAR